MKWPIENLRHYPEIAIFLTLAVGFAIGEAQSKVFALGYTITYAVGNTLLIIWSSNCPTNNMKQI